MYSGEYDVCDVTPSVYSHWASLKICLATVRIEPTTFGILAQCSLVPMPLSTPISRFCILMR